MKIGVVIPCYNRINTLRSSVLSVLEQSDHSFSDVEIVVVDDGSTDNSVSVIQDLPVKILSTTGRRGACHARNIGISALDTDWIMFNDSDDIWLPHKLERLGPCLQRSDVDWIAHRFLRMGDERIGVSPMMPSANRSPLPRLLRKNFMSTQCLAIRRGLLESVNGFDESLGRFQDWDLAIRLAETDANHIFLNNILCVCVEQENSISRSFEKGVEAREMLLRKHSELFSRHLPAAAVFLMDLYVRRLLALWRGK